MATKNKNLKGFSPSIPASATRLIYAVEHLSDLILLINSHSRMASEQINKKRKKNASENLQPDLMNPPYQQNPVSTPKPVSEKRKRKEKEHQDTSAESLHHKPLDVPIKPAPPGILLTLVGAFLTSYGFHDTLRQYTTELASRKKLNVWPTELETKLPNGFPDLVTIYEDQYKEYQKRTQPDTISIGAGDSPVANVTQLSNKNVKQEKAFDAGVEETSSSGSNDSSDDSSSESSSAEDDSDVEMKDAIPAKTERRKRSMLSSSSTSSSTSDSDADDEEEATAKKALTKRKASLIGKKPNTEITPQSSKATKITISKDIKKKQPRKASKAASSSSSSSSSTSSSSESSEDEKPTTNPKPQARTKSTLSAESSSSPSSSDEEIPPPPKFKASKSAKKLPKTASSSKLELSISKSAKKPSKNPSNSKLQLLISKSATDSSVTLDVSSPVKPSAPPIAVISVRPTDAVPTSPKRPYPTSPDDEATTKPAKKPRNAPFQRVPSDTKVDPKLASNAYRGHDYGDKAHNDLSVTRGKDFTKEKNKKKRGSYRGGAIDVTGGKGIKFED